ncbi:hypothetical protein ACJX0J_028112, partial [Zea mays]
LKKHFINKAFPDSIDGAITTTSWVAATLSQNCLDENLHQLQMLMQPKGGGMLTLSNLGRITISNGSNIQSHGKQEQLDRKKYHHSD